MRVSLNWLREYVEVPWGVSELADRLTMAGVKVENVESPWSEVRGLVAGRIVSVRPHPSAERLSVVAVDVGGQSLSIVTGAPGLQAGQMVATAVPGAVLPGGLRIETADFKGIESQGMLCSATEILTGGPHLEGEGILEVEGQKPGVDLVRALELDDRVLELDLTPNYSPCLSMLGVAREVAALTGGDVRLPQAGWKPSPGKGTSAGAVRVRIDEPRLCGRFTARLIWDVKVGHSPFKIQRRLIAAGMRPLNNIVDMTNYVMMEVGQPLHAFDYDTIKDHSIIVRLARDGERLVSLDGAERSLTGQMLVIADPGRAIGLAGVMGGLDTEVTAGTKTVLLESAYFDPINVRKTANALALRSEAALRFEKGVDPNGQAFASGRAARIAGETGAGDASEDIVDCHPVKVEPKVITLRTDRVRTIVYQGLSDKKIGEMLGRYGFGVEAAGSGELSVTVPTRRVDVSEEIDLVEEVARLYGYDRIEPTLLRGASAGGGRPARSTFASEVREAMLAAGSNEIGTFSMIDPRSFDVLRLPAESPLRLAVPLLNPLVEEQSIMRTVLAPGLLEALKTNANYRVTDVCVFEIGRVFHARSLPVDDLPVERLHLGVAATGRASPPHWKHRGDEADFYYVKGLVEEMLSRTGFRDVAFEVCDPAVEEATPVAEAAPWALAPALHPYRRAFVRVGGRAAGIIGEVHPGVLEAYGIPGRAVLAEFDLDTISEVERPAVRYRQLPRFPAVARDVAVVAPEDMAAADIMGIIRGAAGGLLADVTVFDVYSGGQVPEGKRSLAFSLTYRAGDRTLTDAEVDAVHSGVRRALEAGGLTLR